MRKNYIVLLKSFLLVFSFLINSYAQNAGYNYMGKWNSLGVPDYLEAKNDTISQSLLDKIFTSLPESKNLLLTHPEYIAHDSRANIYLKDSCEVFITFVGEGAGYKNVLGYYTYTNGNPPSTINDIVKTMTVLFPNSSAKGSGGGLIAGNKIRLGNFPKNTVIGLFVLADGYKGTSVTNGVWRLFSNENLNPESSADLKRHNVLLKDAVNSRIILGFEDVDRSKGGSDNDFNDVLFYIRANPFTAIDTTGIPPIENPLNNKTDISIIKTQSNPAPLNGEEVTYTITLKNEGSNSATNIEVSDLLANGLVYVSHSASKGSYSASTGIWKVAELDKSQSAQLTITVKVDLCAVPYNLGPASDYNVFALQDINQPSCDTEGRVAVGNNAYFANYTIGHRLPSGDSLRNVLVVGNNLSFLSGGIFNGNVVYGNATNLPADNVSIVNGKLIKDKPLNFSAAGTYLNNLSSTLSKYDTNAVSTIEYGHLRLTGKNPLLNVFNISAKALSETNECTINVPNGAVVLVNVSGTEVSWTGGLTVEGTAIGNVLYNFYDAKTLSITGIDIRGSVLAPKADLDFPAGLITGQVIAKNIYGSGQFNYSPFIGNIPLESKITNKTEIVGFEQTDTDTTNNSSSVTLMASIPNNPDNGDNNGETKWQTAANLPLNEIIWTITSDADGNLLAGTFGGKIYRSNIQNTWTLINEGMGAAYIWAIHTGENGLIYAATEKGLFKSIDNGKIWTLTSLKNKDVRAIIADSLGNLYAGVWGQGIFKSVDSAENWTEYSKGLTNLAVHSLLITPSSDIFAGTFGSGVEKLSKETDTWQKMNLGYDHVWTIAADKNGNLFAGTYGGGLFTSSDNGMTWNSASYPNPSHVYSINVTDDGKVYLCAWNSGVYVTDASGTKLTSLGLKGFGANSLVYVPSSKTLYAGTTSGLIYKLSASSTSVNYNSELPEKYSLEQNYPNPFNPETTISYSLTQTGNVELDIYDILGTRIASVVNESQNAGTHKVTFNASNLSSGVYFYRLRAGSFVSVKKLLLLK